MYSFVQWQPHIKSSYSFQWTPDYTFIQGLWILIPSFPAPLNEPLHSSYALPAPKPKPIQAGHALLLNSSTEKTTPNDRPSDERISREERHRSHCHIKQLASWTPNSISIPGDIMTSRSTRELSSPSRSTKLPKRACLVATPREEQLTSRAYL